MAIGSYRPTKADKLADLKETCKVDAALIKHYEFILNHFNEIIAVHDEEIAKIEEKKEAVLAQFIEAPEKLIALNKHLDELKTRINDIKDTTDVKKQKVRKLKNLKAQVAELEKELSGGNISLEELEELLADA
jgi:predicted RNase H-like nuclease (RuvC/YqgF family)